MTPTKKLALLLTKNVVIENNSHVLKLGMCIRNASLTKVQKHTFAAL